MRPFWRARCLVTLLPLVTGFLAAPAAGQTLDQVDALMRDGRMEAAREALLEWQAGAARPSRDDRQRALWYRAVLTVDPAQAEPTLRRLALEYPGGSFTDQALYRLGLAARLRGQPEVAAGHFRTLVRDYPNSPVHARARDWLRRSGERPATADADGATGGDQPPAREPGAEETGADRPQAEADGAGGDFSAQVGAFGSEENARGVARRLEEAGFQARVVLIRGSDFFRVRVGRFQTADEARALIERLRASGFDAGLGTAGSTERPPGGGGPAGPGVPGLTSP